MMIRCKAQSEIINEKLLPLWGWYEITLEMAENLRETDEETAEILNEAGKTTLIYKKKMRNHSSIRGCSNTQGV